MHTAQEDVAVNAASALLVTASVIVVVAVVTRSAQTSRIDAGMSRRAAAGRVLIQYTKITTCKPSSCPQSYTVNMCTV